MSKLISNSAIASIPFFTLALLISSVGCNNGNDFSLAPVSGIVTANSEPVAGIEVVFYPKATEENPAPGPFAKGKTDSEGRFTLVARGGETGAFVGVNRVGFELPGAGMEALEEAQDELQNTISEGDANPERVKKLRDKVASIRKKTQRFASVPKKYFSSRALEVIVPPEGLTDHPVDLTE